VNARLDTSPKEKLNDQEGTLTESESGHTPRAKSTTNSHPCLRAPMTKSDAAN
jgi:hypothetical protein